MPVRLQLLGTPTIDHDGVSVALPFERRSQLIALLALRRTWVARSELAAMLWPDQPPKLAFSNLRKSLFRMQGLAWGDGIESQGGSLRYFANTDVLDFESALREHRTGDALELFGGTLLAGFDDDANEAWTGWLSFERNRLHAAWRGAALVQLSADVDSGAATEGIALAARLLEADPLDEAALRAQMTLLAQAGQTARAREVYRDFVARLADQLGISPGTELQALHESLGKRAGARAAAALPPGLTTAPAPADDESFIGRSAERRRIAELLARDDVQLLCLTGPGGIGKTRLARRVQRDLAGDYADGAHFVPLEDLNTAIELATRIARDIGVTLRGRAAPIEQLAAALRERQMLIVLDNFEQLAGDAAVLEPLLAACPRVKLLVTTRVRLGLAAEQLMPLEGLPTPESEDTDRIEAFDAVRVFVAAARRVEPALVPSTEAAAIVEICRRVDGLPLALELAAAWTRMLSCAAIAAELREGTDLLRATDTTRPARHASIEQVFEQSWRRLAAAERETLARLSVFQGGFSAEAARAIAAASLPVLGALADKSLLRKDGARLSLHPLVQQLAAARLGVEERAAARAGHAAYFHQFLAQIKPGTEIGDRAAMLAIDSELENCRLAWSWSIAQAQVDTIMRSVSTLQNHYDHRGRFEAGLALLRQALDAPQLQHETALQAKLLGEAAQFEYRLDRYADAEATASRALAAATRASGSTDGRVKLRALSVLGACTLRLGRLGDARRHFKQVLALATADKNLHNIAGTLDHLALVEKRLGHFEEALRLSLESLVQHRRIGDSAGVALCLNNLGSLYLSRHDHAAAAPHLREALAICERDGLDGTRGYVLENLSEVAMKSGDSATAASLAARAIEVADATGNRALWAWAHLSLSRLALQRGDLAAARAAVASGVGMAVALGMPVLQTGGVVCFAELLHAQGATTGACRVLTFAVDHPMTGTLERDEMRAHLARWGVPDQPPPPWPGIGMDELLQRISAESDVAHAPLLALLQPAPR